MTERTSGGSAGEGRREPEEQEHGAWPMPPAAGTAEEEHPAEEHPGEFRPDSPEGRGGQMEDLSPDDFE